MVHKTASHPKNPRLKVTFPSTNKVSPLLCCAEPPTPGPEYFSSFLHELDLLFHCSERKGLFMPSHNPSQKNPQLKTLVLCLCANNQYSTASSLCHVCTTPHFPNDLSPVSQCAPEKVCDLWGQTLSFSPFRASELTLY